MRKIFVCIGFLLLSCFNLSAHVKIDEQIAVLEDSVKIKIERYGEESEEVTDVYFELSELCYNNYIYKKALQAGEKSLKLRNELFGEKHLKTSNCYRHLGKIHKSICNYGKALWYLNKSLQISIEVEGKDDENTADIYCDIGLAFNATGEYEKALDFYYKALEIYQVTSEGRWKTGNTFNYIGDVHLSIGEYVLAKKFYKKASRICTLQSLPRLGNVYKHLGRYNMSLKNYKYALKLSKKSSNYKDINTANSYNYLGRFYSSIDNYIEAIYHHEQALKINKRKYGENHFLTAISYNDLGKAYQGKGDFPRALNFYNKSLKICFEILGTKHYFTTKVYTNLGHLFSRLAHPYKAIRYYNLAHQIYQNLYGENHQWTAYFYTYIGKVYQGLGDYPKALQHYKKTLLAYEKKYGENNKYVADVYIGLGSVYISSKDYSKAIKFNRKALEILITLYGKRHLRTAKAYYAVGYAYRANKEYPIALQNLQKAVKISDKMTDDKPSDVASAYNLIGTVYYDMRDYPNALQYYSKALRIYLKVFGEKHPTTSVIYCNIASVMRNTKKHSKSLEYYKLSLECNIFGGKHPSTFKIQEYLSLAYENLEQYSSADSLWNIVITNTIDQLKKNYLFLSEDKKVLYLNTIEERLRKFYSFSTRYGNQQSRLLTANLLINSKSQVLDYTISTNQIIENINDENLDSIAFQLNCINQKVAKAELLSKKEVKQKGWSLDTLRLQQDELASQVLEHLVLEGKLNLIKYNWQQIQEKLKTNEALIDYFSFYDKVDSTEVFYAMLIKKDEPQPVFIPLTAAKPVDKLLKAKNNFPLYIQYKEARQEMYGYVWQALEPHLQDIKTIHLSPVASLNKVDFESLQNEEGQYLAGLYDFHYYSSSKDFYKQTESQPDYADATLYGHIAYFEDHQAQYELEEDSLALRLQRDTLQPLPATLHEVNAIESICTKSDIHPTLLTIGAAKEDTIAYFSGDRAPGIIHFATHGAYLPPLNKAAGKMEMAALTGQDRFRAADNPLQRSMLMLSNAGETWQKSGPNIIADNDGILTALEVTNLDLSNTELVVLSACNSGIGSQHTTEGVFGLPRAFKLAGVDKILVSLWPVEDETTKELMIQFYTNLLEKKQDAATALRNAKAEMRKRNDAPKKWAGFVLVE